MSGVGLKSLTICTTDLEKTKQFYEAIGFEIHKMQNDWSAYYYYFGWLDNDVSFKIVLSGQEKIIKEDNIDMYLEFTVENVVETIKKLAAIQTPILAPHPVIRHNCDRARVADPDGRQIKLRNKKLIKVG